ncbi:MAG: family N-acetyltransferase, partial [Segetibacter sp.]|nr:family N-acetyltransferase [Segetibacter sp.]
DERVLLRPLSTEDEQHLLPFSLEEPDLWKYSLVSGAAPNLKYYLQIALDARAKGTEYPFIVFDKKQNAYAGSTRFYDINEAFKTLQLGYTWYGKAFQGTGMNQHCKYLLLQFVFENLGYQRLELRADNDNVRSIAAMKSIGCRVDGILRSNMPKPEGVAGRRDSIVLSVLKDDWFGEVKERLQVKMQNSFCGSK